MPSFDIVSQVNSMEVDNAYNQAKKELATRFDFKDSGAEIVLEKNEFKLRANDAFKMQQLIELLIGRLAKRGISLKNVDQGEADLSPLGHARQSIKLKQGIDSPTAKEITHFIRQSGLKVTAAIQGDEIRVSGKSRDDLQSVIAALKNQDWPVALSYTNFRE